MNEAAQRRMADVERLMNEPLLQEAFASLESKHLEELLRGPPSNVPLTDHDRWRREKVDLVVTARAVQDALRAEMLVAKNDMKPRAGRA
jgi:hypothetical protein